MRNNIPIELQARVFSARDALQYSIIPISYLLGGVLADYYFKPFMTTPSALQRFFSTIVETGAGSGLALIFLCSSLTGTCICILGLYHKRFRELN
ncbi:hypothetical protein [Cellulosilyticum ruminicola]|uniref:hypothetical protein n=1 Tax=Cellulosilyticum ruminicola TaxID=425254 RepID=UPI00155DA5D7|nr:hypothetical protein [Cellulosilyticum ruminicola]